MHTNKHNSNCVDCRYEKFKGNDKKKIKDAEAT